MAAKLHPLAEYPLANLKQVLSCSRPVSDPAYLNALMLEASLAQCAQYVVGNLLDVGCGRKPYRSSYFSAATSYTGIDQSVTNADADIVGSALDLPFGDQTFDTVVGTEILEHVPDPLGALREMRRVLKTDGHLVLTTPMYWPRHEMPFDYLRFPYDGLLYFAEESGFTLVRMFNRGHAYAFLGQVMQHALPVFIRTPLLRALINKFFLWCDRRHQYDALTLGWTIVAVRAP